MSEEDDLNRNILEKGEYPFHVETIELKSTKSKLNLMLELKLSVMGNDGKVVKVKDWVVIDMEEMAWKFRHFAYTCGLADKYEAKTLEARDFLGKHGVVKLSIRDYEQDGEQRKANAVADYIKPGEAKGNPQPANSGSDFVDDDIPL
jgi:uncharacterized protein DUF669